MTALLQCRSCRMTLVQIPDQICFYKDHQGGVHLAVKPEFTEHVFGETLERFRESPKKVRARCLKCKENVGVEAPFGPLGRWFTGFGPDKVILGGISFSKKSKWKDCAAYSQRVIDHRTDATLFGPSPAPPSDDPTGLSSNPNALVFPDSNNVGSFLVSDLVVSGTEAKEPQLRAYIEACLGDMILMMPTGYGKTFVGALVMARFRQLNPSHLVAFVVDRIPLVYQQADEIERLTGLQLCRMCGESRTTGMVRRLVAGSDFDGVVCTAGTLWHEVSKEGADQQLRASDFSLAVLDECHHATGNHTYSKLLRKFTGLPTTLRPRLLGMSASPFSVSAANPVQNGLELSNQFARAPVYSPDLPPSPQVDEFLEVDAPSGHHCLFLRRVNDQVCAAVESINRLHPLEFRLDATLYERNLPLFKGDLRSVSDMVHQDSVTAQVRRRVLDLTSHVWALIEAGVVAELVGLHAAEQVLAARDIRLPHDPAGSLPAAMPRDPTCTDSPTFAALLGVLRSGGRRDESIREASAGNPRVQQAIVFVSTRSGAKAVHRELNKRGLRAGLMLGHGGYDGMDWHGNDQQEATIKQFRAKTLGVLVSTSVVEEGLDIPSCDLVLRLCCSGLTLLSYVQGRGRARLAGSRHIVMGTRAQREMVDKVQREERLLKSTVQALQRQAYCRRVPSVQGEELYERVKAAEQGTKAQHARHSADGALGPARQRVLCEVVIPPQVDRSPSSVCNELERAVRAGTGGLLAVSRCVLSPGRAWDHFGVTGLCGPTHSVALCELGLAAGKRAAALGGDGGETLDAYDYLVHNWDFHIGGAAVQSTRYQPRSDTSLQPDQVGRRSQETKLRSESTPRTSVSGGCFLSPSRFVEQFAVSGANAHVSLAGNEICITIEIEPPSAFSFLLTYSHSKIHIPISSMVGFGLFSPSAGAEPGARAGKFYFPVTTSVVCNDVWIQAGTHLEALVRITACDAAKDHPLVGLLRCRVLCVTLGDSESVTAFRSKWMARPHTRSIRIFDTRITVQSEGHSHNPSLSESDDAASESLSLQHSDSTSISEGTDSDASPSLASGASHSDDAMADSGSEPSRWCENGLAAGGQLVSQWICLAMLGSWRYVVTPQAACDLWAAVFNSPKGEHIKTQAMWTMLYEVERACLDCYFTSATADLTSRFQEICAALSSKNGGSSRLECGDTALQPMVEMPSVVVTPARVTVGSPVPIKTNRLLRLWMPRCRFVSVHFRDEGGERLFGGPEINERVSRVLHEGFTVCEAAGDLAQSGCWDSSESGAAGDIMSTRFRFVCCSASQLREQNAIFTDGSVDEIRASLVPDYAQKGAAKQMSSLGLFCTADWPTIQIPAACRRSICDVANAAEEGGHCLTDGAGLLGRDLAEQVAGCLVDTAVDSGGSSALQVRYAGMKGVLTVSPLDRHLGKLVYRASMLKAEAPHDTLCVVKAAKSGGLRLNREVVTLLEGLALQSPKLPWSQRLSNHILGMQETFLSSLAQMFVSRSHAAAALAKHVPKLDIDALNTAGLDPVSEPYWLDLLQTIHRSELRNLRSKTHIPVQLGRLLMGIPDPLGVLGPGEIFCRIHDSLHGGRDTRGAASQTITGNVLVYRNPCLHPGDLQVLSAVDSSPLERAGLCNVVVFSVDPRGAAVAHDCSGGDLDGDMFAVVWDPGLVPPWEAVVRALNYDALAESIKLQAEGNLGPSGSDGSSSSSRSVEAFFVKVLESSASLGKLAHLHLALCDQVEGGACNSLAIELSKAQSVAVDFPKTGVPPEVPGECLEMIAKNGYPDFMEKTARESYMSERLLGVLYSRCKSLADELLDGLPDAFSRSQTSPLALRVQAFLQKPDQNRAVVARFRSRARDELQRFEEDVQAAMARFGLKRSGELWLGLPFRWVHPLHATNKEQAASLLRHTAHGLVCKYQAVFNSDSAVKSEDDMLIKAAVWYAVSQERGRDRKEGRAAVIGFGWIVKDVMARVCQAVASPGPRVAASSGCLEPSESLIGPRAVAFLRQDVFPRLLDTVKSKQQVVDTITDTLQAAGLHVRVFGSVALGLAEPDSDIDLLVYSHKNALFESAARSRPPTLPEQRDVLSRIVSGGIDPLVDSKREILVDIAVPIITCSLAETNVDLCACPDGAFKASMIVHLYRASPAFFALFVLVTHWARRVGLIKHPGECHGGVGRPGTDTGNAVTGRDEAVLKTGELHAAILFVMGDKVAVAMRSQVEGGGTVGTRGEGEVRRSEAAFSGAVGSSFIEDMMSGAQEGLSEHAVGELLVTFLDRASRLTGEVTYRWTVPHLNTAPPEHVIAAEKIETLASMSSTALHLLAASQSFEVALEVQQKASAGGQMTKLLSASFSRLLASAMEWHARRLSVKTGAEVRLEQREGKARISLTATGSQVSLELLRRELKRVQEDQRLAYAGYLSDRIDLRFMSGCTHIMVPGPLSAVPRSSSAVQLKFLPFDGECNAKHRHCTLFAALPADDLIPNPATGLRGTTSPRCSATRSVATECSARVWRQCQQCPDHLRSSMTMTFHFGNFYLMKVAESGLLEGAATLTCKELTEAITKDRRHRTTAAREEYDMERVSDARSRTREHRRDHAASGGSTVPIMGGGRHGAACNVNAPSAVKKSSKVTRRSTNISAGFCPTLFLKPSRRALPERETDRAFQHADKVLLSCGFVAKLDDDALREVCKVTVKVSTSHSVIGSFAESRHSAGALHLRELREGELKWYHGTIISGAMSEASAVRVKVETQQLVSYESDLFRAAMGDTRCTPPISFKANSTQPCIAPHVSQGPKARGGCVVYVRSIRDRRVYEGPAGSGLVAAVTHWEELSGENLGLKDDNITLSMQVPQSVMLSTLKSEVSLAVWFERALTVVDTVVDAFASQLPP